MKHSTRILTILKSGVPNPPKDSTSTASTLRRKPCNPSLTDLYRRISAVGNPGVTIVPILDQWIAEGRTVTKQPLLTVIKELRRYKRYSHALEVCMWMTNKRKFDLSFRDVAIPLDLIAKVHGIEQAENYFNNIPVKFRDLKVYSTLLNCYAYVKNVEKSESVMQKMRDLGLDKTVSVYNVLLNLYYQTGNHEKLDTLMQEMEENGINFDHFTFGIRLSAYAAASDVAGIDEIIRRAESNHSDVLDCTFYSVAATGYTKTGHVEKAFEMLKKSERLVTAERTSTAFNFLLTQYAAIGKRDEVLRLWELYKKKEKKINSKGYMSVITSLLKFDDIDSAEKILDEWEARESNYDIRVPNFLIGTFCRKGLVEKAEILANRVMVKGGEPNTRTYYFLATGYLQINHTGKGVEAMKKAILIGGPYWKPSKESLAACLEYLKTKGDVKAAKEFIGLLWEKGILPGDARDKLVNYIKDSKLSLPEFNDMGWDASIGNGETIGHSELDEDNGNYRPSRMSDSNSENY